MADTRVGRPGPSSLSGRRYREDKPKDCAYCYWWKPGKKCCERKECYYLLPPEPESGPPGDGVGDCRNCPYGKYSPCIGFCTVKLLLEMKGKA